MHRQSRLEPNQRASNILKCLPRSAAGKACDYALGQWGQLRRFLDYGQIELSNNLAENAIRPLAIGSQLVARRQ